MKESEEPPDELKKAYIFLSWDQNKDDDLAGYEIFWGLSSKNYNGMVDVGDKKSQFILKDFAVGYTYYFAVKAYDTSGNRSSFSDEFSLEVKDEPRPSEITPPTGLNGFIQYIFINNIVNFQKESQK